ncbi:UNVERIFIED_CONTAM: transmembrane protein, putative [Hammondia hammondi]|eukprot:XP_008883045.1 transmembrane protein, putative [Hammondia hammondi]
MTNTMDVFFVAVACHIVAYLAVADPLSVAREASHAFAAQGVLPDFQDQMEESTVSRSLRGSSTTSSRSESSDKKADWTGESAEAHGDRRISQPADQNDTSASPDSAVPPTETSSTASAPLVQGPTELERTTGPFRLGSHDAGTSSATAPGRQMQHPISTMRSGVMRSSIGSRAGVSALHQRAAILQHSSVVRSRTLPGMIGMVEPDLDSTQHPAGMGRLDMYRQNQIDWLSGFPNIGIF